MLENLRTRASLLFLAVTAFLLLIWQIPKWDSGWVQAIGSITAIGSGFAYVAFQQQFARKELRLRESWMRDHVEALVADALDTFDQRLKLLEHMLSTGEQIRATSARDPMDIVADELLLIAPGDLGSGKMAIEVRKVGHWIKIVVHATAQAVAETVTSENLEEAVEAREAVSDALTTIRKIQAG